MRIVLVQPPVHDFYDTDIRLQPLGLCYLKAALDAALPGLDVIVRDYHTGRGRFTVKLPAPLRYLRSYYPSADAAPFCAFHAYYHFGLSFDAIERDLAELQPDMVGISALFTPYFQQALAVAERVKAVAPHIPVVMGGAHVSAVPESVLAHPCVDFVIRGEGESALVQLARHLRGEIAVTEVGGLGYKHAGAPRFNAMGTAPDVESLPPPALHALAQQPYAYKGKPMCFMITSRSCPHQCSFCSVHTTFGHTFRRRSVENVLAEIELRYQQGFRVIDFEDDNLTFYKEEFKSLCRALMTRFPNRELELLAMNGISYISLDTEMLELMFQAGFSQLNLALVSSDTTVRETTKRPHTLQKYTEIVRQAHALGFRTVSYQILGLPQESVASMVQTLAFNSRLPLLLGASPFYLTPSSPIAKGLSLDQTDFIRARLSAMGPDNGAGRRDAIYTLFLSTRILNFIKGLILDADSELQALLQNAWPQTRTQLGMKLLATLRDDATLHFSTPAGLKPNRHFQAALFADVLREAGTVCCQNGRMVHVASFARQLIQRLEKCVLQ